jgi:hypothetical protein
VQDWVDSAVQAVLNPDNDTLEKIKGEVITALNIGLFDKANGIEQRNAALEQVLKGLAFLWVFGEYELIDRVCAILREQQEEIRSEDKYPNAFFALIHAAAILHGKKPYLHQKVLEIIRCVEGKFERNRYKIWIGLSYVYFLLWKNNGGCLEIPERQDQEDIVHGRSAKNLIGKAIYYAKKAIDWLGPKLWESTDESKQRLRLRKYYYALNNYVFFLTLTAPHEQFETDVPPLAKKLLNISTSTDIWQANRFADTLARFYFRMALINKNNSLHKFYFDEAFKMNAESINNSQRAADKILYELLAFQLKEARIQSADYDPALEPMF